MPPFGPISRPTLIRALRSAGFGEPEPGRRHAAMRRGTVTVRIPNPHRGDISRGLLAQILREAGVSRDDWEKL